jgi:hypothetical protein
LSCTSGAWNWRRTGWRPRPLARAFVFNNDFCRAGQIYDRHLPGCGRRTKKSPPVPGAAARLGRPAEALAFLLPLQQKQADDLEVLGLLVRAYAGLGTGRRRPSLWRRWPARRRRRSRPPGAGEHPLRQRRV